MNRRGFLTGLAAFGISAPSIVRAASLMPVRGIVMDGWMDLPCLTCYMPVRLDILFGRLQVRPEWISVGVA